ncbi:hypothetical protein AVL62_13115 [Serinicoccus chungangensis]|uniref:Antitoxin protein n=1 Tax=Serinicoccus chungangensis TaxID=767452 RepID=A0A0W8IBP2_9MICO|nr:Rv0909 family putative TA system antitoxin [Serinicoccus chungangensis]KUG57371.1 hypothetical protein AVL62_13115 [Serinicoccus chungangensis]
MRLRATIISAATRHRAKLEQGLDKLGEVANTKTHGRYEDTIRKGRDHARTGLDKLTHDRPDPDSQVPAAR